MRVGDLQNRPLPVYNQLLVSRMSLNSHSKRNLGQTDRSEKHGENEVASLPLGEVDHDLAAPTRAFSHPHLEASVKESIALNFHRLGLDYEDLDTLLATLHSEYNTFKWAI